MVIKIKKTLNSKVDVSATKYLNSRYALKNTSIQYMVIKKLKFKVLLLVSNNLNSRYAQQ